MPIAFFQAKMQLCFDCHEREIVCKGRCRKCYTVHWRKEHPDQHSNNIRRYNKTAKYKIATASKLWHKVNLTSKAVSISYMICPICNKKGRLRLNYKIFTKTNEVYTTGQLCFEHRKRFGKKWKYDYLCIEGSVSNQEVIDFLKFKKQVDKKYGTLLQVQGKRNKL